MIRGAVAAALTPLVEGGQDVDEPAVEPYVDFLAAAGLDGVFALGTTGEGMLLGVDERRRAAERFAEAAAGRLALIVHCGAQTTSETVALAEHAAALGVDGIAVVAPPYYAFAEAELEAHFVAAAKACSPTPFYLYEIAPRSGYSIPLPVVHRVRERSPNLAGLKVSDTPYEAVRPYILEGLDVFVGSEPLYPMGRADGAAGCVSGLASAFPEPVVELVKNPSVEAAERVLAIRSALERVPFVAAAKRALGLRGVPVREDVRAPLLPLTADQRVEIDRTVSSWLGSPAGTR